jgi:thiamine biosynthesis lipoprotein
MQEFNYQFRSLGHIIDVTSYLNTNSQAEKLFLLLEKEFNRIHIKFFKNESSIISKLNKNAGISVVEIDEEVAAILEFVESVYEKSKGAFNCLNGALKEAWYLNPRLIPSDLQIKKALELSNFHNLNWTEDTAYISEFGSSLDLSAILLGYALEKAKEIVKNENTFKTLIRIGEQYLIVGTRDDESPWQIPIKHPRSNKSILFNIPTEQSSDEIISIGHTGDFINYNYREQDGIADTISSLTGYPIKDYQSCWIWDESPLIATSLSRIIFLMGNSSENMLKELSNKYLLIKGSTDNSLGAIRSNIFETDYKEESKKGKVINLFPNPSSHHHSF